MTRTDVVASSRPRGAVATGGSGGRSRAARALSVLPLALILGAGLVTPTSALAAEGLSPYTTTTPTTTSTTPTTTPATTPATTPTTPSSSGTSPSKESSSPSTSSSSGVSANTETTKSSSSSSKSGTLPFTGFDLRWSLAIGFTLIAAGASLLLMQRRTRRDGGR